MDDPDLKLLVVILLAVIAASAGWYFRDELLPKPQPSIETPPESMPVDAGIDAFPKHPIAPYDPPRAETAELVPLPPLDDSDGYFLLALVDVFGAAIEPLLVKDAVIDRFVATVDNLPLDHVAEKVRPVGPLAEAFRADGSGGDGPFYLSEENYRRYDPLLNEIAAADINTIVDTYRRFYPLLQQSYERIGYPNAYFNDRVVEVIDHLLSTPQVDEPIQLTRPNVLYEFADPRLEALSSGQKLLLRMGTERNAIVKGMLQELREQLVQQ